MDTIIDAPPTALTIVATFFADVKATAAKPLEIEWERLVAKVRAPESVYARKAACPLIKLARFGDLRTDEGCLRHNANVIEITGIEGDYDGEAMPITEAAMLLADAGIECVVYTSASHTPDKPRWRVLAPLSRPHPPGDHGRLVARLNGVLGGMLSDESFVLSQTYYIGRVEGAHYDAQQVRGTPIDLLDNLPEVGRTSAGTGKPAGNASDADLRAAFHRGENRRNAALRLAARYIGRGMEPDDAEAALLDLLGDSTESDPRHREELAREIRRAVRSASEKFGDRREVEMPDPSDRVAQEIPPEAYVESAARDATLAEDVVVEPPPGGSGPKAQTERWPAPLRGEAFHGLAGEVVRAIEPQSEADPAALLLQFLAGFGVYVGRGPHLRVEGDEHHPLIFPLIVGNTAKARKGTSAGRIRQIFDRVREPAREDKGLSSGEGLKHNVRDPVEKLNGKGGREVSDEGVSDKRLLVVEAEFAQALKVGARPGNTLSVTIREAWDSGRLSTLTKTDPITATGAHVGITGHITLEELRRELTATDSANGFANRFLFVCSRRSKRLPFGGALPDDVPARFAARLSDLRDQISTRYELAWTDAARELWAETYDRLSEGRPGLLGAVTARGEAQTLRLALLYALLDGRREVDAEHIRAGLAVWDYAEASARYIFGDAVGDAVADEILRALRTAGSEGLTRTAIRDLFGRNLNTARVGAALDLLQRSGLATMETRPSDGGRPSEIWRAV